MKKALQKAKHPMQPIVLVEGIARFKINAIVRFLLDTSPNDLNVLVRMPFSKEDWTQFYQLIGYSVSGYGEFDFLDKAVVAEADAIAAKLCQPRRRRSS